MGEILLILRLLESLGLKLHSCKVVKNGTNIPVFFLIEVVFAVLAVAIFLAPAPPGGVFVCVCVILSSIVAADELLLLGFVQQQIVTYTGYLNITIMLYNMAFFFFLVQHFITKVFVVSLKSIFSREIIG